MQSSKEQQGEIRKSSSVINAKKQRQNDRMGKTRDLSKKIRYKMGSIKDKNDIDLTEAENIKKRWQEYIQRRTIKKRST